MFLEKSSPKKKHRGLKGFFDFRNNQKNQIGLLFFIAFVVGTTLIYQFEEKFSEDLWRSQPSVRYKLADDIIDRELFIGKTKEDIIELLGPPSHYNVTESTYFSYYLGNEPSFFRSGRSDLILTFKNNRVIKVVHESRLN